MSSAAPINAPLMLSVSGARGLVGVTMTPNVASDFAAAFGSFIKQSSARAQPLILVGRDSRPSGAELAQAAMSGLISVGCRVIDLGVVATPTVAVMIEHYRSEGAAGGMGGVVITASHNPIQWNGLKCLTGEGAAPPPLIASEIIRRFEQKQIDLAPHMQVSSIRRDDTANRRHVDRVLAQVDVQAIRAARFKVVLDSVNGAGCVSGRMLLDALGCDVVHINGEAHGNFAHTPEPTEENLIELRNRMRAESAACGFAQDPDADRLAIVDETGTYIGEEYTLVLAAKRVLDLHAHLAAKPLAPGSAGGRAAKVILAANLSTSRMLDDLAAQYHNVQVLRTAVGEANVVAAMQSHGQGALVGGEGNGGVIFPRVCWVRDSLTAMAMVLDLLAVSRLRLSAIIDQLPRYMMIKHKFDLSKVGGSPAVQPMLAKVTQRFRDQNISTIDGVRIDFPPPGIGWVHLRPSNTEPIVRLIAEAKTKERAWLLVDQVAEVAGLK